MHLGLHGYSIHWSKGSEGGPIPHCGPAATLQEAIKLAEAKAKEMLANGELCNIYVRRPTGERFWIVERFLH